jgi:hypothetical protein
MEPGLVVRYAESDDDVIAVHQFLCVVAGPTLPGPIDAQRSAFEVWRVCTQELGLMAIKDDRLVGTMGIIRAEHWWGKISFLAGRWFFTLPGSRAGKPLIKEAKAIARGSDLELHLYSEARGTITILNKSSERNRETSAIQAA